MDVKGVPLKPSHIRTYVLQEMDGGRSYARSEIIDFVVECHETRGGVIRANPKGQVRKVLFDLLKEDGLVERPTRGFYRKTVDDDDDIKTEEERLEDRPPPSLSPVEETESFEDSDPAETPEAPLDGDIGCGEECIYAWYFPAYRRLADLEGRSSWPMKVGRSQVDPRKRMIESAQQAPEKPVLSFVHHVRNSREAEKWYHAQLGVRGTKTDQSVGIEWFEVSPSLICELGEELERIFAKRAGNGDQE